VVAQHQHHLLHNTTCCTTPPAADYSINTTCCRLGSWGRGILPGCQSVLLRMQKTELVKSSRRNSSSAFLYPADTVLRSLTEYFTVCVYIHIYIIHIIYIYIYIERERERERERESERERERRKTQKAGGDTHQALLPSTTYDLSVCSLGV
jgi:hypothetical protein